MKKVVFTLNMPNVGSWNGKWSGEGRNYIIKKSVTDKKFDELKEKGGSSFSWYYSWSDGWGALVTCREIKKGERLKKSDGFCGYDWMVMSIMDYGKIMATHEIKAMNENKLSRPEPMNSNPDNTPF